MFGFRSKDITPAPVEVMVVSKERALELQTVWSSSKLQNEVASFEALASFIAVDKAAGDEAVRQGILDNIAHILATECHVRFSSDDELEAFVEDLILLKS